MLNNTTRRCPACGVMLRQQGGNTGVCPQCYRSFCYTSEAFSGRAQAASAGDGTREVKIVLLIIGIMMSLVTGLLPITVMLVCALVGNCKNADKTAAVSNPQGRVVPTGTYLKKRSDYIRVFRTIDFASMPLGIYGERALHQVERLDRKQEALAAMLGKDHPFIRSGDEAEMFILKNCKQVLYRLKYCDQGDPAFCRVHAEYLEERLAENEKILGDFEKLVIEVTQLDLDMPQTAPCLDVLADTLHNVRTQDGALPDQFDPMFSRQMMMRG